LQDDVLASGRTSMRRQWPISLTSGTTRWFRTGATLQSAVEETVTEGNKKTYRFGPTSFYAVFGEYGTGRLGSQTGRPAPTGYRYGSKPGMRARRFGRHTIAVIRPEVNAAAVALAKKFAANMTSK
jgi:hypothetical protein